jgi:hypothetical protein
MPKRPKHAPATFNLEPEASLPEAVASGAEVTEVNMEYIGPDYATGIMIHGSKELIRPRDFSPEQIAAFLEKHPNRANWWFPSEKL